MENTNTERTRSIIYISMFVAIIAVCAQISIPMPGGVPITLQTWAVSLAGVLLGAKKGAAAAVVYMLLGAAGVPVFTNFGGGFGVLLGPTGGFILSFPLQAALSGFGAGKSGNFYLTIGLISGTAVNLFAGMFFLSFVASISIEAAFAAAILPFIPGELVKIVLVVIIGKSIKTALIKNGVAI